MLLLKINSMGAVSLSVAQVIQTKLTVSFDRARVFTHAFNLRVNKKRPISGLFLFVSVDLFVSIDGASSSQIHR